MNNYFVDIAGNKNAIYIRERGFNLYFSMTDYFLHNINFLKQMHKGILETHRRRVLLSLFCTTH